MKTSSNKANRGNNQAIFALQVLYEKTGKKPERGGWVGGKRSKPQDGEREREESVKSLKPKILHINQSQKPLETHPKGVFQQKRKNLKC